MLTLHHQGKKPVNVLAVLIQTLVDGAVYRSLIQLGKSPHHLGLELADELLADERLNLEPN